MAMDRRKVKFISLALLAALGVWSLSKVVLPRTVDYARLDFNPIPLPKRDIVTPKPDPGAITMGKINALNAKNVPKLEKDVRCVQLQTVQKPICIDTKDKFIGPTIINGGTWERHVWNPMQKLLNEDPELNLIDIGANIGVFTISAAALGRRVVAVEAFYENIQRMSESLRMGGLQDKVTIVYNAVSDIYEDVFFWKPVDNPGGTHTLSKGVTLAPNKPIFEGEHNKINTIFMNDLTTVLPFKKAVLKIDIEGYENKAFKKAESLLDNVDIKALFMEWTFVTSSEDCMNIVRIMVDRGYVAHTLDFKPLSGSTRAEVGKWPGDIVWLKKNKSVVKTTTAITVDSRKTEKPAAVGSRNVVHSSVKIDLQNGYSIDIVQPATVPSVMNFVECVKLRTANNNLICIDTRDKFIGPAIRGSGAWEPHIWEKIKKFLDKDPEAGLIDIGANIGVFTISAASLGRQVLAVEAFYENIQRLSESLRLGKITDKVSLVYNAVSDVYEKVHFWKPVDNPGGTHTLSEGVTLSPQQKDFVGDHSSVSTIHLDDLVKVARFKKAVMKIDIEGFENRAFKSIEKLLDSIDISALFMEWAFVKSSPDCLNIVKIMTSRNYVAHTVGLIALSGDTLEIVKLWPGDIIWVKRY